MRHKYHAVFLFACLLVGCRADKETFTFGGEHLPPPEDTMTKIASEPKELSRQDSFKIELAVYGYLLQRHFWDDGEYSAIFVQGSDDAVDAMIQEFPNHFPPIKTSDRVQLRPNRAPIDKDTGRPAMILSVDALDPEGDTVQAIGRWYAGGAVSGFYTFALKKTGDDWVIESSK